MTLMVVMSAAVLLSATCAWGAGPAYRVITSSDTTVAPGGTLWYFVQVSNIGDTSTDGVNPTKLTVTLPQGMSATSAFGGGWSCSGTTVVTCSSSDVVDPFRPFNLVLLNVTVDPGAAAGPVTSTFSVDGGGAAASGQTVDPITITATPPQFGVDAFDGQVTADPAGSAFTQAGGHPYAVSTSIDFNRLTSSDFLQSTNWPVEPTKDIFVDLPPGFVGNPTATGGSKCTTEQIAPPQNNLPNCPPGSQVGTVQITPNLFPFFPLLGAPFAVYNMVAPPDVAARFGFNVNGTVVTLDATLRSGSDYGLSVNARDISEGIAISGTTLTFWGVPADPSHDPERSCPGKASPWLGGPSCATEVPRQAFIRLPTSCASKAAGLKTDLRMDSWEHPGDFAAATFTSHLPPAYPAPPSQWGAPQGPTGCQNESFEPTLAASPTPTSEAGAPTGLTVDLRLPQDENPDVVGTADLKKAVVTLPRGTRISPSAANGLGACSSAQAELHSGGDANCPDSSKIGTVHVVTPLLQAPLDGSVYLAKPHDNPSNSLLGLYLVVKGPGLIIKLYGKVDADPTTGQLTTTFDDNPQLPFELLHLELKNGPRAPLVNPPRCGSYTTHAVFTGWNDSTVSSDSSFDVSLDGNGAPCNPAQFSPQLTAGTKTHTSGAFSEFDLQLQRTDTDGEFRSLSSLSLPPGLLADVGSVSVRCTEAQADAHACPAESHIGTVNVGAGAGPDPIYVPGDVYLMGGFSSGAFRGDPFGLAVVVHATAGPFDLGYVVVKAVIQIHDDGSITTQTEPFPSILEGIPLQLKDIRVSLDRPHFILNPTNCNQMGIAGSLTSTDGQSAAVSSRFQVGECARLAFKPSFTVSTVGKTSKANGASLHVHLATHEGPSSAGAARESNIAKVDVQLPVVLPARLPTLQKACTEAQFATDPAGCPAGSFVGMAIAHTPILTSPLSGPAILVSHGGEAFPDLVLVLQGEGIRIDLTGHTQIKKGITYNHFETVPDAPVTSFDLTLPAGPHGILTTDVPGRNLCATTKTVTVTKRVTRRVHGHTRKVTIKAKKAVVAPLLMPTTMTAQNGAVIHQNTKIAVTGCAKAKVAKHTVQGKK